MRHRVQTVLSRIRTVDLDQWSGWAGPHDAADAFVASATVTKRPQFFGEERHPPPKVDVYTPLWRPCLGRARTTDSVMRPLVRVGAIQAEVMRAATMSFEHRRACPNKTVPACGCKAGTVDGDSALGGA
jgi:hypothetical protein